MRKELGGILLFFLVILTLVSLLTFNPNDPAIGLGTSTSGKTYNFFGPLGAHIDGLLLGGFGIGAFWVPLLLFLAGMRIIRKPNIRAIMSIIWGGLLLMVATGCLTAFQSEETIFNIYRAHSATGIILRDLLTAYAGRQGGFFTALLLLLIGLMTATGFSPVRFSKSCWRLGKALFQKIRTRRIINQERKLKTEKRVAAQLKKPPRKPGDLKINAPSTAPVKLVPRPKQEEFSFMSPDGAYSLPSVNLLDDPDERPASVDNDSLQMLSRLLEKKLEDFGVNGAVTAVTPGPVVTMFEYEPASGVKINKIVPLADDLALALRALSIRIVAPIPGKSVIGIEIPNMERETVRIKDIIVSESFEKQKSKLTLCLGKDIIGEPVAVEMDKMPHLLVAGSTGSGKSVALNAMICSLLYKATPDEVKLLLIDPKRIELSFYNNIPHLITPVVTDMRKATNALSWAVREMEDRYVKLSEKKVRNISQYNRKIEKEQKTGEPAEVPLPYIVIIIDEYADLMAVSSREVEAALTRLAQMARAAGIHLIIATQRPSVNVITGIIKANFPTRISFQVSSKTDSRTILDANGAESLLGSGDMLFLAPGTAKLQRIHGAYISEEEITRVIEFLKRQKRPAFNETVTEAPPRPEGGEEESEYDEHYDEAVALVTRTRQASISMIQRHLRIGYNRAARIVETMEREGVVGPSDGVKPREVLVAGYDDGMDKQP